MTTHGGQAKVVYTLKYYNPMKKRLATIIGVGMCGTAFSVLVFSCYILPRQAGSSYNTLVTKTAKNIEPSFKALAKTADLPVFGDLGQTRMAQQNDLAAAAAALTRAVEAATVLGSACDSLPVYGPITVSRDYRVANQAQRRCHIILHQTQVVTEQYRQLTTYLSNQLDIQSEYRSIIMPMTNNDDLVMYYGQGNNFRQQASSVNMLAERTKALPVPYQMQKIPNSLVITYTETASAFEQLALAADSWNDEFMTNAASSIETAVQRNDTVDMDIYSRLMMQSPTLKWVREINEKLGVLLP